MTRNALKEWFRADVHLTGWFFHPRKLSTWKWFDSHVSESPSVDSHQKPSVNGWSRGKNGGQLLVTQIWDLHPGKLTWNTIMEVWKMMFLFNLVIFMFHVNFQGSTLLRTVLIFQWGIFTMSTSLRLCSINGSRHVSLYKLESWIQPWNKCCFLFGWW